MHRIEVVVEGKNTSLIDKKRLCLLGVELIPLFDEHLIMLSWRDSSELIISWFSSSIGQK